MMNDQIYFSQVDVELNTGHVVVAGQKLDLDEVARVQVESVPAKRLRWRFTSFVAYFIVALVICTPLSVMNNAWLDYLVQPAIIIALAALFIVIMRPRDYVVSLELRTNGDLVTTVPIASKAYAGRVADAISQATQRCLSGVKV